MHVGYTHAQFYNDTVIVTWFTLQHLIMNTYTYTVYLCIPVYIHCIPN